MQTTSEISKKVNDLLLGEFTDSITIGGNVVKIDVKNNTFTVCDDNKITFFCRAKTDVSHLVVNDNLILICLVKFNSEYGIHFLAEHFYTVTEGEKMQSKKKAYEVYKKNILSDKDKYKTKLNQINNMKYPKFVKNIGLIVMDSHKQISNKFMVEFKTKCKGNLFVYNMKKNNLATELSFALEFMKKYHDIDLVCIVMDNLNLHDIIEISSFGNIRYMFGRKDFPYIISVSDANKNDRIVDILANKHFKNVTECINYIDINQNATIKKLISEIDAKK